MANPWDNDTAVAVEDAPQNPWDTDAVAASPQQDPMSREREIKYKVNMAKSNPLMGHWVIEDRDNIENEGSDIQKGMWHGVVQNWEAGRQHALLNNAIGFALHIGDPIQKEKAMRAMDTYLANLPQTPADADWLSDFLYANVTTAGQVFESAKASGTSGLVFGGIGAGMGAVASILAGGLTGEEPFAILGGAYGGLKIASRLGMAEGAGIFAYRMARGEMYYEMARTPGIRPEIAETASAVAAIPYALIEMLQLKGLTPNIKKAISAKMRVSLKKALLEFSKKYAGTYTKQVSEEVSQKVISIIARDIAAVFSDMGLTGSSKMPLASPFGIRMGGEDRNTGAFVKWLEERIKEVYEEGKGAAKGMALISGPGPAIETSISTVVQKQIELAEKEEAAAKEVKEAIEARGEGKRKPADVMPVPTPDETFELEDVSPTEPEGEAATEVTPEPQAPIPVGEAKKITQVIRSIVTEFPPDTEANEIYGLRVIDDDVPVPQIGDILPPSYVWEEEAEGEFTKRTDVLAENTSVIYVAEDNLADAVVKTRNYFGKTLVLVKGEESQSLAENQVDPGEAGIIDPEVVAVFKRNRIANDSNWILSEPSNQQAIDEETQFFKDRLTEPELADQGVLFDTPSGPALAVPLGDDRVSGSLQVSFKDKATAQEVFDELSGDWAVEFTGKAWDKFDAEAVKTNKAKGIEYISLAPGELARWKRLLAPIKDEYAADLESKGLPAKRVMEELQKMAN